MIAEYVRAAIQQANYREVPEEGLILGEIAMLPGVTARAHTLLECRSELVEVLEDWLFYRISRRLPVPDISGVSLAHLTTEDGDHYQ
jgi:predicted RNase H-like HicB family nuclease